MRLTNALNFGLFGLVVLSGGVGLMAHFSISSLKSEIQVSRNMDEIAQLNNGLEKGLRAYALAPSDDVLKSVRSTLVEVTRNIEDLRRTEVAGAIIGRLDEAVDSYGFALRAYVEQESVKTRALELVDSAALRLSELVTREALSIAQSNDKAAENAQEIQNNQVQSFLLSDHFTEIMIGLSRLRQANQRFVHSLDEGTRRSVKTSIDRIESAIRVIDREDVELLKGQSYTRFKKWFQEYKGLFGRLVSSSGGEVDHQVVSQNMAQIEIVMQTEADRLRERLQSDLGAQIERSFQESELVFQARRKSVHLTIMHLALRDALGLVRIVKETEGADIERLSRDMSIATERLRLSYNALSQRLETRERQSGAEGRSESGARAKAKAAISELRNAWAAATLAASKQLERAEDMSETIARSNRLVGDILKDVESNVWESIQAFFLLISIATLVFVAGSVAAAIYFYRHMTQPLSALTETISRLSKGDLAAPVPLIRTRTELAELSEAAEVFRRSSLERMELERENARKERRLALERAEAQVLEVTLRKEKEKAELQRRFVSMVSHEFRTPLAIIDGQARFLLKRLDKVTQEILVKRLGNVTLSVERLIELMEGILSSSRLEAGTVDFRPEEHNLRALIAEVCVQQDEICSTHRIVSALDDLPVRYLGDPRLLRQVVTNLLSNAVKYSPAANRVDVSAEQVRGGYMVQVQDYGLGIPEDEVPKLASQFFRASTSSGIAGTGIGLNLVKAFVEMHGGNLDVTSKVGEGSTFSIFLPLDVVVKAA